MFHVVPFEQIIHEPRKIAIIDLSFTTKPPPKNELQPRTQRATLRTRFAKRIQHTRGPARNASNPRARLNCLRSGSEIQRNTARGERNFPKHSVFALQFEVRAPTSCPASANSRPQTGNKLSNPSSARGFSFCPFAS